MVTLYNIPARTSFASKITVTLSHTANTCCVILIHNYGTTLWGTSSVRFQNPASRSWDGASGEEIEAQKKFDILTFGLKNNILTFCVQYRAPPDWPKADTLEEKKSTRKNNFSTNQTAFTWNQTRCHSNVYYVT